MKLSIYEAIVASVFIGLLMFAMRALPFAIFRKKKVPAFFGFIEKFIPAISIAVLFLVCLKEKTADLIVKAPSSACEVSGVAAAVIASIVTAVLHIWKKNAMVSIFGGTILYMILNYFL
ncbi:MAG: AzlD domain-containing protein [Treponema sp.]|nr:AzlD domain-containing protein [Candidatus Treponema equifaecale]